MRVKCKKIQLISIFLGVMLVLLAFLGTVTSCNGDADLLLREGNKKIVARVYPTGGQISPDAKDLQGKYIGLTSTVISDASQITQYLSGEPTILKFVGVTSIECELKDPVFQKVNKLIFDKDIRNVGSYAFDCAEGALNQVIFEGDVGADIGYKAFGEADEDLLIVVPNSAYTDTMDKRAQDNPRSGNYWYWEKHQIALESEVNVIYVLPALNADIDENTLQLFYTKSTSETTLKIATLPEYPYHGSGKIREWTVLYKDASDTSSTNSHGAGEVVQGASVEITSDTDGNEVHLMHIPANENDDLKACVTKWLPTTSHTTIRVIGNWPSSTENVTGTDWKYPIGYGVDYDDDLEELQPHHGEILVEIGTARSYFEKSPTVPRDATGRQIAFWESVWTKPTKEEADAYCVFNGKSGEHWDLEANVPELTNELGYWSFAGEDLDLYAIWITAATNNGIYYWYQYDDTHEWRADWANQDAETQEVTTPLNIVDIADVDWRPGYRFVEWRFKDDYPEIGKNKDDLFDLNDPAIQMGRSLTTITNVYAVWTTNTITVNMYGNEAETSLQKMYKDGYAIEDTTSPEFGQTVYTTEMNYNDLFSLIYFEPERVGYKFNGWYTTKTDESIGYLLSGSDNVNSENAIVNLNNGEPVVNLYASWTPYKTTITVKNILPSDYVASNPDVVEEDVTVVYEYEGKNYISRDEITTPTKFSYFFAGAYLDDAEAITSDTCVIRSQGYGSDPATSNTEILNRFFDLENVVEGYTTSTTDGLVWTYSSLTDNTLTVYAMYSEGKSYRVRFYQNWVPGDPNQVVTQEVLSGQKAIEVTSLTDGTRNAYGETLEYSTITGWNPRWWRGDGYHFFGWYTTNTTFSDYGADDAEAAKYDFDESVKYDIDLYAHWVPKKYTINLNSNLNLNDPNLSLFWRGITGKAPDFAPVTTPLDAYYDGLADFETYPMDWYVVYSGGGGYVFTGWHEEQVSRVPRYVATTQTDSKSWLVKSEFAPEFQENVDWTSSSGWDMNDARWTNGESAGCIDLYAVWLKQSDSMVFLVESTVTLQLTTGARSVVYASGTKTEIDNLHLSVLVDSKSNRGSLKNDATINDVSLDYVSNSASKLEYYDGNGNSGYVLDGFYSKPQGQGGIKVINSDGSFNASGIERNDNNGYVLVDNNGSVYWVGGGCTVFAHWTKN